MVNAINATFAVSHKASGMLMGLGVTESDAWADAKREQVAQGLRFHRHQYSLAEAPAGHIYETLVTGGLATAVLIPLER